MPRDPIEIAEVPPTHVFQLLVFQFLVAEFLALLVISLVVVGHVSSLSWVAVVGSIRFCSRIGRKSPRRLTTPPTPARPFPPYGLHLTPGILMMLGEE